MLEEDKRNETKEVAADRLATAAFVLGIISLFSTLCCCPFVFSALGIILALLSKGGEKVLRQKAKTGLILSCVGIAVSVVLTVFTVALPFVLIKANPEFKKTFIESYENTIKENEEMFRQMYGDEAYEEVEEEMLKMIEDL